jgi:tetratricopeptide (TPR) repeat protein
LIAEAFYKECAPLPDAVVPRARALFDWLWQRRPRAYRSSGNPLLTVAIEAHLSPDGEEIGNCLALTSLYLALGEGLGLPLAACHLPDAGGRGPHVFAVLQGPARETYLELTRHDGFDFAGWREVPGRCRWGPREVASEVLLARGNQALEARRLQSAVRLYRRALALDQAHGRAWLNLGITWCELGRVQHAEECFARAHGL